MKDTEEIRCPYCNGENFKKNGIRGGIQRYRCKKDGCEKSFSFKNTLKYEPHERAVLSFLLNVLENDFYDEASLKKALKPNKNYHKLIKMLSFDTRFADMIYDKTLQIRCYQPRLLICSDERNITFVKIPPADFRKNPKEDRNQFRKIEILDSFGYRASGVRDDNKFIPYTKEDGNNVKNQLYFS